MSEENTAAPVVEETAPIVEETQNIEAAPETAAELETAVEEAIEDGATEEEVVSMLREYELKVNGKTKKVKIDLSDEKDIVRRLQMAEAGQSAMQDKAELEKMLTAELLKWKGDPSAFFAEMGLDPNEWAEQMISDKVEELQKTPEQIERETLMKELEVARSKLKEQEDLAADATRTQLQQKASADLESEIVSALDDHPGLPRTRKTVTRIADAMLWCYDNDIKDVQVKDVVPAVEAEIRAEFNEFISELPDDMIESFIGKKSIERLRKKRLAQAKSTPSTQTQNVTPPAKKDDKPREKINAKDYFRNMR